MRRVCALLLALTVFATAPALAEGPVSVTAAVDREVTSIGDRITLTVEVLRPTTQLINTPQAVSFGGDIEPVLTLPPEHSPLAGGMTRSVFRYQIAAFVVGDLELAPIAVTYTDAAGVQQTALSNPVRFTIRSVIPPGQQPSDIRDVKSQLALEPGVPSAVYRPVLLSIVLLDLLLLAGIRLFRPRARPAVAAAPAPAGAWTQRLDDLAARRLGEEGDYKGLYRQLAVIIRAFLAEEHRIPARALTRAELEARMASAGLDSWQARLVNGLLQEADRVVYAEYVPAPERARSALDLAYQVVEFERPVAATEEPALAGA